MDKRIASNGLALLGLLASTSALAEIQPGFYVGAGIGEASVEIDGTGFDDSDTAFKVFGGYNINRNLAVEAAYFDGGTAEETSAGRFVGGSTEISTSGLNLSLLGRVPLNDAFSLHARVGIASYDVDSKVFAYTPLGQVNFEDSDSNEDISYGLGAAFNLTPSFELRADYEAVDASDGELTLLSVSALYKF
jgi:OOP family OmpA-OmpF porin